MAGVAEAVRLIVVVVARRETLHAALDGRVGNAVPVLDAGGAEVDVVPGVGLFHAHVVRHAQPEFVGFVFDGVHQVAVDAQQFHPVGAHLLQAADARAGLLGGAHAAQHGVDEDARRGDLALRALAAQFERALRVRAHVADGGDAARQPDVQLVLDGLRLAAALLLQVGVRIDQPGQHVLAGGVDDRIHLSGDAVAPAGDGHRIQRNHVRNQVIFDEDVLGSGWRECRCHPPRWHCGSEGGGRACRWWVGLARGGRQPAPEARREPG